MKELNYEKQAIEMYQAGKKGAEIREALNISNSQLYNCLRKHNIQLRAPQKAKGKAKTNICPKCKTRINPAKARFCCMWGADIRKEEDILIERLGNALMACSTFLPQNTVNETTESIRAALKYIEKQR